MKLASLGLYCGLGLQLHRSRLQEPGGRADECGGIPAMRGNAAAGEMLPCHVSPATPPLIATLRVSVNLFRIYLPSRAACQATVASTFSSPRRYHSPT
eukprot:TRINITY_DN17928_c0_g2_i2.p1 TRINITY_DN17928_c0_g2~~TRINITY_DN17928_c0_g2_i2.p1  ORF type:complete len:115 (+),score=14.89 TRINITY_DN17928_c0_g2_i2:52-345(+)